MRQVMSMSISWRTGGGGRGGEGGEREVRRMMMVMVVVWCGVDDSGGLDA